MKLNPYLSFNGQCETAFKFYEQCLGGHLGGMMTYGESPMADQVSSDWHNKILHAYLTVGDQELMGADTMPGDYVEPKGFSVLLNIDNPEKAKQVFQALSANGNVQMPLQPTFWAAHFGMLTDQFGTPWMINGGEPS